MKTKYKELIAKELKDLSREEKLDEYEVMAVLDGAARVYNQIAKKQEGEDLYQKAVLSMPAYDVFTAGKDEKSLEKYMASYPKNLIKGFKFESENMEEKLAELVMRVVDFAVENGYEENKTITISDKATYKAEMERFDEAVEVSLRSLDMIRSLKGEEGVEAVSAYLLNLAKGAISSQRKYFVENVDNVVKFYSKIELAKRNEEEQEVLNA